MDKKPSLQRAMELKGRTSAQVSKCERNVIKLDGMKKDALDILKVAKSYDKEVDSMIKTFKKEASGI